MSAHHQIALRISLPLLLLCLEACGAAEEAAPSAEGPQLSMNPPPADPAPADPIVPGQCREVASMLVFSETFNAPISGWTPTTSGAAGAGHGWAIARGSGDGQLVSDPAGETIEGFENRIDTPVFSLRTNTRGYVRFKAAYQHSGTLKVLMRDGAGRSVAIADLSGTNPSWPTLDCAEAPVPKAFLGNDAVQLSLVMAGGAESGVGALIDNLRVAARSCAAGSLLEGQAPPALKAHRPFSIVPCTAGGPEPSDDP